MLLVFKCALKDYFHPVRPYPEKDRKRQETPKKTLFSTEFYII